MRTIPLIEPEFANRIATRYVSMYRKDGFQEAKVYLDRMAGDNVELREHLVKIIVDIGASS
jgi:hypothetical protein